MSTLKKCVRFGLLLIPSLIAVTFVLLIALILLPGAIYSKVLKWTEADPLVFKRETIRRA